MQYPRTYRVASVARRWWKGIGLALIAIAIVGHVLRLLGLIHRSDNGVPPALWDIGFVALTVMFWYQADRFVTLYDDAIEVTSWLSVRRLARDQIRARRIQRGYRGIWYHVLIPVDPNQRELKLPTALATDAAFSAWLRPIHRIGPADPITNREDSEPSP